MFILFIDDDPDDVQIFSEAVRETFPNAVCGALYSCDGIAQAMQQLPVPDYIFVDSYMFPIGGKECLLKLKAETNPEMTKIFMYSGSMTESERRSFLELGAAGTLIKGATYEEIRGTLLRVIG